MTIDISEFKIDDMTYMPSILIVGRDKEEKERLINTILNKFCAEQHIIVSDDLCFYKNIASTRKFKEYSNIYLRDYMNEFMYFNSHNTAKKTAIILDNCFRHPEMHHIESSFYKYLCDHRLYLSYPLICTTEMPIHLIDCVRYRFDYVILIHDPNTTMKQQYYYHYADMFRTYEDFNNLMFELTKINSNMLLDYKHHSMNCVDKIYKITTDGI